MARFHFMISDFLGYGSICQEHKAIFISITSYGFLTFLKL